ncbi:legume-like lectin family-domain-containing protein [Phlyctochytrium arcticum]|nr:legume-like lectin family-domain-containing protein [Phlyctochytrium arcticum]
MRGITILKSFAMLAVATVSGVLAAEEELYTLYSYSLQPPFIEENLQNRWWNFGGDSLMEVNRFVRLTPDVSSKRGWLWTKQPFVAESWVVEFDFKVHGTSGGLHGDGFAFWYTTDKEVQGPVFGNKDLFNGLGVFFDTYANGHHSQQFPYVSAMLVDGKTSYDHGSDGFSQNIGGCSADFREKSWPTAGRVRYIKNSSLEVAVKYETDGFFKDCFIVNNVTLPTTGYLGFTAHTGGVSDNHDIIKVVTKSITNPTYHQGVPLEQAKQAAAREAVLSSSSGFSHFLIVVLSIGGFLAACYGIWVALRVKEERSFKRF